MYKKYTKHSKEEKVGVNLSAQDIQSLKDQGYSDKEIREAVAEIEQEQISQLRGNSQATDLIILKTEKAIQHSNQNQVMILLKFKLS